MTADVRVGQVWRNRRTKHVATVTKRLRCDDGVDRTWWRYAKWTDRATTSWFVDRFEFVRDEDGAA